METITAGTQESSDVMITLEPMAEEGVEIELKSTVEARFGNQIRTLVRQVAQQQGLSRIRIRVNDHGALDCTIRARLRAAIAKLPAVS